MDCKKQQTTATARDADLNRRRGFVGEKGTKRFAAEGERMGRESRRMLVGFVVAMALGTAVYLRLWAIDYAISADDTELLRRQFDLANREAMDESAEWRMRYDVEAERATDCDKQLIENNKSHKKNVEDVTRMRQKVAMLQQENLVLVKQVEALKKEVESAKLQCRS
ncbi:hypothetical protein HS088_TW13G00437 [Tripterygium wilfordii]|uniref:Uncharacterized protein n=1 Tax=Tripterygium wilfordii TaxID=458696 RepID=A0A7J7CTW3_TRIWF|nr:uncharacterized protein LOC120012198 [Tripterygium wilfordii]KAF5737552.1 hypothetical protein HS088_TW13G00437 [Tripterygium wilfordii]